MRPRRTDEQSSETAHTQTARQLIRDAIRQGPRTSRDLAHDLSMRERDVIEHLEHLRRSANSGEKFVIEPAVCRHCSAIFEDRERLTRPSRCPRCKSERIVPPKFVLE